MRWTDTLKPLQYLQIALEFLHVVQNRQSSSQMLIRDRLNQLRRGEGPIRLNTVLETLEAAVLTEVSRPRDQTLSDSPDSC